MKSLLAVLLLACVAPAQEAPRNVLVMVVDDLGWPEWDLLPSVKALAEQGILYRRAYSQPVCTISRLEFHFGQYHRRFGVGDLSMTVYNTGADRLPTSSISIAEL